MTPQDNLSQPQQRMCVTHMNIHHIFCDMIGKGLETHVTRDQMSGDLPCLAQPPLWPKLQECQNTPIRKYTNTQIDK